MGGMSEQGENKEKQNFSGFQKWIKGLGIGAFFFFLIKGLIWLAVFFGAAKFFAC